MTSWLRIHTIWHSVICSMVPASTASFSIITQNIGATPFARDGFNRVSRFTRAIRQPALRADFVCIQEAFTFLSRLLIAQPSKQHPHTSLPHQRDYRLLPSGLAFRSKFPITEMKFTPFLTARNQDLLANKGIQLVRVSHPNFGIINFLNVHMQASYRSAFQYADVRARQLDVLHNFISKECANHMTIMSGDFNCTEDQSVYQQITDDDMGFQDALRMIHTDAALSTWLPNNPYASDPCPPLRLDYIFIRTNPAWKWLHTSSEGILFSGAQFYTSTKPMPFSDHEGIRMTLVFEPAERVCSHRRERAPE